MIPTESILSFVRNEPLRFRIRAVLRAVGVETLSSSELDSAVCAVQGRIRLRIKFRALERKESVREKCTCIRRGRTAVVRDGRAGEIRISVNFGAVAAAPSFGSVCFPARSLTNYARPGRRGRGQL